MVLVASWCVFFGVLLAPGFVHAEEGLAMLQRMAQASRQLTYSGTFVYKSGNRMETSSIAHALVEGREVERIAVLDGSPREVIRDGNEIKCFFPEENRVIIENNTSRRHFPALLPIGMGRLLDHYVVRSGGAGRIAGVDSQRVMLEPRDMFRYRHEFWMDAASGLLLKASIIDERGEALESFAFTQLKIGGPLERDALRARFASGHEHMQRVQAVEVTGEDQGWTFRAGLPGFHKISAMTRQMAPDKPSSLHVLFSDGVASISVFIEPATESQEAEGLTNIGPVNVYRRQAGGSRLVVMGEVPAFSVKRFGDGIERKHK
jgi:sigma-E factor negative regulatory protein RseB